MRHCTLLQKIFNGDFLGSVLCMVSLIGHKKTSKSDGPKLSKVQLVVFFSIFKLSFHLRSNLNWQLFLSSFRWQAFHGFFVVPKSWCSKVPTKDSKISLNSSIYTFVHFRTFIVVFSVLLLFSGIKLAEKVINWKKKESFFV